MVRAEFLELVGETLTGIVIKAGPRSPTVQLYLLLTRARHFEFYATERNVVAVENPRPDETREYVVTAVARSGDGPPVATRSDSERACWCRSRIHIMVGRQPAGSLSFRNLPGAMGRTVTQVVFRQTGDRRHVLTLILDDSSFVEVVSHSAALRGCGRIDEGDSQHVLGRFAPEWYVVFPTASPEARAVVN
jgi:hypothetical protein